jgi:hypothetical protein
LGALYDHSRQKTLNLPAKPNGMQADLITVKASRPDYASIWKRIGIGFVLMLAVLIIALWYITSYLSEVSDFVIYLIILLPFLAFFYYIRRNLNSTELETSCTLTDKGLYEEPLDGRLKKRFIPWQEIQSIKENIDPNRDDAPYLRIKIKKSRLEIFINSLETGKEQYQEFMRLLKEAAAQPLN